MAYRLKRFAAVLPDNRRQLEFTGLIARRLRCLCARCPEVDGVDKSEDWLFRITTRFTIIYLSGHFVRKNWGVAPLPLRSGYPGAVQQK